MKPRSVTLAAAVLALAGVALAGAPPESKPEDSTPAGTPPEGRLFTGPGKPSGTKTPFNIDKQGVVLHGYDVVSYFDGPAPLKGSETFTYKFMGSTWRFSSAENRKRFIQDKNKYMPQYGGYSATAVSENKLKDVDPLAYKIVGGKLYLNSDMKVQRTWEQDITENIAKANEYWPSLNPSR